MKLLAVAQLTFRQSDFVDLEIQGSRNFRTDFGEQWKKSLNNMSKKTLADMYTVMVVRVTEARFKHRILHVPNANERKQ